MKRLPFKRISTGVICFGLLFLTFYIRIQGVERIPDRQFTGNDAYLYYKQAETIAEQGYLPARDMERWLPLGWNSLAVKLFFRGEHSDAFVPVYPVTGNAHPKIKVWEIHYPPDIKANPKYLKTGFPEIDDHLPLQ